jgi:hypothetical protein
MRHKYRNKRYMNMEQEESNIGMKPWMETKQEMHMHSSSFMIPGRCHHKKTTASIQVQRTHSSHVYITTTSPLCSSSNSSSPFHGK